MPVGISIARLFENRVIPDATPSRDGVMSKEDKAKLDGIPPGGGGEALSIVEVATNFVASVGNHYRVNTGTLLGSITATVEPPSASNAGQIVEFKKIAAANDMIVTCAALIDGVLAVTVTGGSPGAFQSLTLRSTGTTYDIV